MDMAVIIQSCRQQASTRIWYFYDRIWCRIWAMTLASFADCYRFMADLVAYWTWSAEFFRYEVESLWYFQHEYAQVKANLKIVENVGKLEHISFVLMRGHLGWKSLRCDILSHPRCGRAALGLWGKSRVVQSTYGMCIFAPAILN